MQRSHERNRSWLENIIYIMHQFYMLNKCIKSQEGTCGRGGWVSCALVPQTQNPKPSSSFQKNLLLRVGFEPKTCTFYYTKCARWQKQNRVSAEGRCLCTFPSHITSHEYKQIKKRKCVGFKVSLRSYFFETKLSPNRTLSCNVALISHAFCAAYAMEPLVLQQVK